MIHDHDKKTVIVIGAGLSGIVCSYYLQKNGFQVTLIEKEDDIGGKMGSWEDPNSQVPYEHGYRLFFESYLNFFRFFDQFTELKRDVVFGTSSHKYDWLYSTFFFSIIINIFKHVKEISINESIKTISYFFSNRNSKAIQKLDAQLTSPPRNNLILRSIIPAMKETVGCNSLNESIDANTLIDTCLFLFLNKDPFHIQLQPTRELLDIFKNKLTSSGVKIFLNTEMVKFIEINDKIKSLKIIDATGERELDANYFIAALPCAEWKKPKFNNLPWSAKARKTPTLWSNSLTICLRKFMPQMLLKSVYFPKADNPCCISFRFYTEDIWPLYDFSSILDGTVLTVASVIISDFFAPGLLTQKPMKHCSLEEIVKEVCFFAEQCELFSINDIVPVDHSILGILDPSLIYNEDGSEIVINNSETFGTNAESLKDSQGPETSYENLFLASTWIAGDRYLPVENMENATISGLLAVNALFKKCDPNIEPLEIINFFSPDISVYHGRPIKEFFRKILLWIRGPKDV